jgi:hypothetical protein
VAQLGWSRINLELDVGRVLGVSVNESPTFLLTPPEARLVEACEGARRVFERLLVVARGGRRSEAESDGDGELPGGAAGEASTLRPSGQAGPV